MAGAAPGTRVALKRVELTLDDLQPLQRRLALGDVQIDGLDVALQRRRPWRFGLARPQAGAGWRGHPSTCGGASGPPRTFSTGWQVSARRLALADSRVTLADATVQPPAAWQLHDLAFSVDTLHWPAQAPWPVQAQAQLSAGATPAARVALQGLVSPGTASVDVQLTQLQLLAAAPYLRAVLQPQLEGQAELKGRVDWAGGATPRLQLAVTQAQVAPLRLMPVPATRGARPLAQWTSLDVQDLQADLLARSISLGRVALRQPQLALARDRNGQLDLQRWLRQSPGQHDARPGRAGCGPGVSAAVSAAAASGVSGSGLPRPQAAAASATSSASSAAADSAALAAAWRFRPRRPARGTVAACSGPTRSRCPLSPWRCRACGPASARPVPGRPAHGRPGSTWRPQFACGERPTCEAGRQAAPWPWRRWRCAAACSWKRLPLHSFEPYFGDALPVEAGARRTGLGGPGSVPACRPAAIWPASASMPRARPCSPTWTCAPPTMPPRWPAGTEDDQLLSWASLQLKPLRVRLAPRSKPRIEIGEVVLSDFYSRLVITEQGRFNLRDVQAEPEPEPGAVAAAPAAASAPPSTPDGLPVELTVGATRLDRGRVDFTDRFVRPNYSAQLTELNGAIGRFASTSPADLATIDLRGRVAGTGRLEIRGAFNPTANPLALDIQARTTDLELAPLSPYSGKYAGYAIERGKLSVELDYKVAPDGTLQARNQIVLNQLTFGAAVDSPDATKLPVRLAVALLTDRNGVIDLDLPVSGSINDPQFSVWGIVWKILGNLLSKALTSPFALLSGGGADDLSSIAFVPGTARLAEGGPAAIDKIAKALQERPALRLTVAGHADAVSEKAAVQAAVVDARLQAEQRRDLARAGTPANAAASAALPALSAADNARLLKRLYTDTALPDRPRNLIGLLKDVPAAEMRARLEAAVPVTPDTARELALQRSLRVRDALVDRGLPSERLFLGAPKVAAAAPAAGASAPTAAFQPHVELSLAAP